MIHRPSGEVCLKALVVDDDARMRATVARYCAAVGGVHVCGQAASVKEAVAHTLEAVPDLIVLDARLKDGEGLGILDAIRGTPRPHLIVMTGQDRYAMAALDAGAADVLAKPFDLMRFKAAIDRVKVRAEALSSGNHSPGAAGKRIALVIQRERCTVFLSPTEILFVSSANNDAIFQLRGRVIRVRRTLTSVESDLASFGFVRVHRQILVNAAAVREIQSTTRTNFELLLHSGHIVRTAETSQENLIRLLAPAARF